MAYLTIENFKFGLDTRRGELTSQAGVLATLENGHVNQGGEVDKRKAFVLDGILGINDSNGDTGTFGLENLSGGKTVFGSALPFEKGYTGSSANVLALSGSGSGGVFTITVVNGVVTAITGITNGGAGYAANDYVTLSSTTASG